MVLGDNCPDCEGGIRKEKEEEEEGETEDQGSHLLHSKVTNRLFVDVNHLANSRDPSGGKMIRELIFDKDH